MHLFNSTVSPPAAGGLLDSWVTQFHSVVVIYQARS
jgi:hypothetical protein